jgi:general secretion pathway protein L
VTLQELLNSNVDLRSAGALVRRALAWWIDEIAAMLPASVRKAFGSAPRTLAERQAAGGWRYWRDGVLLPDEKPSPDGAGVVGLLLPSEAVLIRHIEVPRMPAGDVRRMLALDIERLSPLGPGLIHFDSEVVDREAGGGKQSLLLGIVTRATAKRLVDEARADGLSPASLGVRVGGDSVPQRFDFLPAVREAAGERGRRSARPYWWGAVASLLLLNMAVLVGRDMASVSSLRRLVEAQRPAVEAAMRVRREVESVEASRESLLGRGARSEPLRMLNALTEATPPGAWVQHLEWNGQTVRIVGYRSADLDMSAAIRGSGFFTNPRSSTPESAPRTVEGQPFDLTADIKATPRP